MRQLWGQDRLRTLLELALNSSSAAQTEARISTSRWALTRFANSTIHQSLSSNYALMQVRAVFGKKVASGATTRLEESAVVELVKNVVSLARHTDENPDFVSLPSPDYSETCAKDVEITEKYCHSTAESTPESRADIIKGIIAESDRVAASAAGSVFTRAYEHAVMNTLGINSYYRGTAADTIVVVTAPEGGFGYAGCSSADIDSINGYTVGREAAERAHRSRNPIDLPPGDYECVLTSYAAATLVRGLIGLGFWALPYQENRSFLCGRLGKRIVNEHITICDDAYDPATLVAPYDCEGIPRRRVVLVENGVAKDLLYDSYAAHKVGLKSNGHAVGGAGETIGSRLNLIMNPGTASLDQMIAATKRGVLVTRFHYVNVAHLMTATITGMTRDGTFLIEDGQVVAPVKNLRFTQSILEALCNVEMIGQERKLVDGTLVPPLKLARFHFTSATQF